MKVYLYVAGYLAFLLTGQLLWKKGMEALPSAFQDPFRAIPVLVTSPYIILGIVVYGLATVLWLILLSRYDLSYIYPVTSLSFVIATLVSFLWLGEDVTWNRWLGVSIIALGVYVVSLR
jgi:drug/metabolite transporter (DMT)-like permease